MRTGWRPWLIVGLLVLGLAGGLAARSAWGHARALALGLGVSRPMTYLVLVQTSDELRPTGGFITSVGTVRLERGHVTGSTFQKVYAAEDLAVAGPTQAGNGRYIQPPLPLSRYMGVGHWLLRDANWWADFPASARQTAKFWEAVRGEHVDGVIAVNERALEAIFEAVGPVTLANGTVVSTQNLKQVAISRVFQGPSMAEWYTAQTAFSQELGRALLATAQRLPPDRLLRAGRHLLATAERHDLMVSSFEPVVQDTLRELGFDGALGGQQDDYLYLVESNVSYNKLSPFIRHDLEYAVELGADGRPVRATLGVDVANTYTPDQRLSGYPPGYYIGGRWNPTTRRTMSWDGYYGGYTRLYLPLGSRILNVAGFDDRPTVGVETDRTVVGGYVDLRIGDRQHLELEWLPNGQPSRPGEYRLLVQRQPGAPSHGLTIRVALPTGWQTASIAPDPTAVENGVITWRRRLEQDEVFRVTLQPAGGGEPR